MLRYIGIACQRADAQTFVRELLDLPEWQAIDIDQLVRRLYAHFHQVNQVRSATQEFSLRLAGNAGDSLICVRRARVCERIHTNRKCDSGPCVSPLGRERRYSCKTMLRKWPLMRMISPSLL